MGAIKILFVDKVMACACQQPPRGVELFNIQLLKELAEEGLSVTALIHPSWRPYLATSEIAILHPDDHPGMGRIRTRHLLRLVSGRQYDWLLMGNVANRLIGFLLAARFRRLFKNCLVIAHREPSRRVLWAQRVWPETVVVAVNGQIADAYRQAGFARTVVCYGITGAEAYLQIARKPPAHTVDFCVVGNLENEWKGADTAIAAFRALPDVIRSHCRLHLASYHQTPVFTESGIRPYSWMAAQEIPAFLAQMDVMVVPSRDENVMRETFSQVMVQGMLAGLPQIVTRLPILTEKLDQGGGMVCETVFEMTQAMEKLALDEVLRQRLGQQAKETATRRYIWSTSHFIEQFLVSA